jgi:hypothetical protein
MQGRWGGDAVAGTGSGEEADDMALGMGNAANVIIAL